MPNLSAKENGEQMLLYSLKDSDHFNSQLS